MISITEKPLDKLLDETHRNTTLLDRKTECRTERRERTMLKTATEGNRLVIYLEGSVDSLNATEMGKQIREAIQAFPGIPWLLDAQNLQYISSAGLRVLLMLKKEAKAQLTIRGVPPQIYETLSITGFTELMNVQKQLRSISVEGCPVIGRGAVGTVYRLDADTIVKVYHLPDCLPMIENEQKRAKQAFIRGIPTAISYDVVRVGEKYGSVFEMVKAENCNDLIVHDPARLDEIIGLYVSLLKTVHAVEMQPGELPDAREVYAGYVNDVAGYLPEGIICRIRKMLSGMPLDLHAVHGDIQMKNVMLSDQEPLLIDMETLCAGNPVFDFAGLWMAYCAFGEDEPTNSMDFMGIDQETSETIYQKVLALYIGDDKKLEQAQEKIQVLGAIRFLYVLTVLHLGKPELTERRIRHTRERLERLLGRVEELCL